MAIQRARYPTIGLSKAADDIAALWKAAQHAPVTTDAAAKTLGFKGLSGPSRSRLAALKHYGLIEEAGKETMRLSALAKTIIAQPDGEERRNAIKTAATSPKLFQEMIPTYVNAHDTVIRGYLISTKSYSEDAAKAAIRSFRDTVSFAKLSETPWSPDEEDDIIDAGEDGEDLGGAGVPPNGSETDSGKPKKPVLRSGVMYSINLELLDDGSINVMTSDGSLTSDVLKLMTEIFVLKEKYEKKKPPVDSGFDFSGFAFGEPKKQASE